MGGVAMNCLKCGRDIAEDEVFCVDCRLEAQRYPIEPNTVVFLPSPKKQETARKSSRRRALSTEEQFKSYRRRLSLMTAALVVAIGVIVALSFPAVSYLTRDYYAKGQNYTSMTTVPPSTEPDETASRDVE